MKTNWVRWNLFALMIDLWPSTSWSVTKKLYRYTLPISTLICWAVSHVITTVSVINTASCYTTERCTWNNQPVSSQTTFFSTSFKNLIFNCLSHTWILKTNKCREQESTKKQLWKERNTSSSLSALSHSFWPGACWVHMVISWFMLSVTALIKPKEKGEDLRDMRYAWDEGEMECVGEGGRVRDMVMRKT